jgi:hypothetical protein
MTNEDETKKFGNYTLTHKYDSENESYWSYTDRTIILTLCHSSKTWGLVVEFLPEDFEVNLEIHVQGTSEDQVRSEYIRQLAALKPLFNSL